jgi:hypothetical protein
MGGSSSKQTINKLTSIAVDVTNKTIQSCVGSAQQSQLIKINNIKGDVRIGDLSQQQGSSINLKCIFSNEMQTKIQSDVAAQITSFVKASAADLTSAPGGASSDSELNIKNMFHTGIHNETVTKQAISSLQEQTVSIHDIDGSLIIDKLSQSQSSKLVATAIIKSSQYSGVLNTVADKIDASAASKRTGIFNSMFGMLGNIFMYMAIMAVIVGVIVVGYFLSRRFLGSATGRPNSIVKQVGGMLRAGRKLI